MTLSDISTIAGITGAPRPPVAQGGFPVIGHVLPVMRTPNSFYLDNHKQLGPVFRVKFMGKSVNILCGIEANKWCSRNEKDYLQSEGIWDGIGRVYGADPKAVIVNNDGAHHKQLRQQLKDSMSKKAFAELSTVALDQLQYSLEKMPIDKPIDVVLLCKRVIYQQLSEMLVDDSDWNKLDAYSRLVDAFVLSVTLPVTAYLPKFGKRGKAIKTVREHSYQLVKKQLHNNYLNMKSGNFLELLIQGAQKGFYSEEDLPFLSVGAIVAGIDTLAHSMAFAIYAIASKDELKKQLQQELDAVMGKDIDVMEKLKQLNQTRSAVMESMRLYPISPGLRRIVRQDVELNGYQLRKGEEVIVAHTMAHFQDNVYPEPQVFDSQRFLTGRSEHKQPGAFAPFGVGPHICLGAGMAEIQLLFNIAQLFYQYDISVDPDYSLNIQWIPSGKPKDCQITLVDRQLENNEQQEKTKNEEVRPDTFENRRAC